MERTYIGNGTASLVYRLNNNQALNVYFNHPFKVTEKIFNAMQKAKDSNVNVPTPLELTSTTISKEDLKKLRLVGKLRIASSILRWPSILEGMEFSAIRREFIPGKNLERRIIPRSSIRKKVQEQMKRIRDARMAIYDIDLGSFVLRPDGKLFLVDYEKLYDLQRDSPYAVGITSKIQSRYPPICISQDILFLMGHITTLGPLVYSNRYNKE